MASFLDFLGRKYGTDKSSLPGCHNYLDFYARYLGPLRDRPITLLEIGVAEGPSLRMWKDYFQRGKIVGMDIDPETVKHADERMIVEIGDQSNVDDLERIARQHGPFHVINDDGGHREADQILSYKTLLPHVVPGGFYILEDASGNDAVEFMLRLARSVIQGVDPYGDDITSNIESVAFYRETSITTVMIPR